MSKKENKFNEEQERIDSCNELLDCLNGIKRAVERYKFSGNKKDIELLEIDTKNLLKILLTHWF